MVKQKACVNNYHQSFSRYCCAGLNFDHPVGFIFTALSVNILLFQKEYLMIENSAK